MILTLHMIISDDSMDIYDKIHHRRAQRLSTYSRAVELLLPGLQSLHLIRCWTSWVGSVLKYNYVNFLGLQTL